MVEPAVKAEVAVARLAIDWLTGQGWDVYPEVRPRLGWPRADLVAVQAGRIWVVECKTSLSLSVMAQAHDWIPWAHWVSVAVPRAKSTKARRLAHRILTHFGIGLLVVDDYHVIDHLCPVLHRRLAGTFLADSLHDGHKEMGIAGSQAEYWTPFKETCRKLLSYVREHPGCSMKEAVDNMQHHYASDSTARSCLGHWLSNGVIPGIDRRRDGRALRLYPAIPEPS